MQSQRIKLLESLRRQIKSDIQSNYRTVEEFCFTHQISKGLLSQFFASKQDLKVSTLCRIAKALGKTVKIV